MSEVYNLYLNSFTGNAYLATAQSPSPNSDMAFSINWDTFFNGANYRYKKCRLRYEYYSDPILTSNPYDPLAFNSILVLTGLNSNSATKYGGIVLGLLSLDTITLTTITPSVATISQTCLAGANLTGPGQNIEVPKDMRNLNVQIQNNAYNATSAGLIPTTYMGNWDLVLSFELYDPIM